MGRDATTDEPLPHVDEHEVVLPVPIEAAWSAVHRSVARSFLLRDGHPLAGILGAEPRQGFEVVSESSPTRLELAGRHRFSRYRLTFVLVATSPRSTTVRAITDAAFPGLHGSVYRTLVIGTGAHARIVRGILERMRDDVVDHPTP